MTQEEYASKAHAVKTNWNIISPRQSPSPATQAIFDAVTYTDLHSDKNPQAAHGHHVEVIQEGVQYRTLYFTRQLTQEEKSSIDALFGQLQYAQRQGEM